MANLFENIRQMSDTIMRDFLSLNANFDHVFRDLGLPSQQQSQIQDKSGSQQHQIQDKSNTQDKSKSGQMVEGTNKTSSSLMDPFSNFGMIGGLGQNLTFNIVESSPTLVKAEVTLPQGVDKNDVKIDLNQDMLSISGGKSSQKDDEGEREGVKYKQHSSSSCSFMRTVRLPQGTKTDEVKAKWKDGKLMLCLPREEVKTPEKKSITVE